MQLAHIFHYYKFPNQALTLAYKLRRAYPRRPDINLGYIGLLSFWKFTEIELRPKIVGPNTAFTIKNEFGEHKSLIIEVEYDDAVLSEEITSSHPIALAAIGKSIEDGFILNTHNIQEENWTIVDITSKYLYLFNKTIAEYSTLFPGDKNFYAPKLRKDKDDKLNFAPIFKILDDRQAFVSDIENMYIEQQLPIGFIARVLGINPIDVWRDFMRSGRVSIKCCEGNEPERNRALRLVLTPNKKCVIDPLTLYSIHLFEIQDELDQGIGRLGITRSTLDLYLAHIDQIKRLPPAGSLGKINGDYVHLDSLDEIQEKLDA